MANTIFLSLYKDRFRSKSKKPVLQLALLVAMLPLAPIGLSANEPSQSVNSKIRVATFNVAMHRDSIDGLVTALQQGTLVKNPDRKIANIALIIRAVRPDIILLNEFDYREDGNSIRLFQSNYLEIESETIDPKHSEPVIYPYHFTAPSNTGISSGVDFDNDSEADGKADVYGYGVFPGQYGMVVLSKFPVLTDQVRTFQNFLWRDMPDARLPKIPAISDKQKNYYSEEALSIFRLSSKSHWDIPVNINGQLLHLLASHPTPPVFDGPEDRNGLRNHDEIRFWADYIGGSRGQYIYDDNTRTGPLPDNRRFVILGDLNASPVEGESTDNPMRLLLQNNAVNNDFTPRSNGATANTPDNSFAPAHTTTWALRVDYVLPSRRGLRILDGAVHWPSESEPGYDLVANTQSGSDHRLVWLDLEVVELDPSE